MNTREFARFLVLIFSVEVLSRAYNDHSSAEHTIVMKLAMRHNVKFSYACKALEAAAKVSKSVAFPSSLRMSQSDIPTNFTKGDLALCFLGTELSYGYAIPIDFYDDVMLNGMLEEQVRTLVWYYGDWVFGIPCALTKESHEGLIDALIRKHLN